jgi:hypothetical protein
MTDDPLATLTPVCPSTYDARCPVCGGRVYWPTEDPETARCDRCGTAWFVADGALLEIA